MEIQYRNWNVRLHLSWLSYCQTKYDNQNRLTKHPSFNSWVEFPCIFFKLLVKTLSTEKLVTILVKRALLQRCQICFYLWIQMSWSLRAERKLHFWSTRKCVHWKFNQNIWMKKMILWLELWSFVQRSL